MSAKVERLVNLTVALLETRRPLTLAELRERTGYYRQGDAESSRRMFERDKDDLRRLGVPVETRGVDAFEAEVGYFIDRDAYELPDIELDRDEVAALALALQMAGEQSSKLALSKLAARAPDPAEIDAPPGAVVAVEVAAVEGLADPLMRQQAIRFPYRTAAGEAGHRTVDPYAVVQRRGVWYVVGRDHDRDALRVFRLDRVAGEIEVVGDPGSFRAPDDLDLDAAVGGAGGTESLVAVAPTARWEAELIGGIPTGDEVEGWPVYRIPGVNPWRLSTWALGLGPEAQVLEPPEVVDEVVRRLRALAGGPA